MHRAVQWLWLERPSGVSSSLLREITPASTTCINLDNRACLQHWVFTEVFNTRLFKLSREQDPPFATAAAR
jgi:hypothetical protein